VEQKGGFDVVPLTGVLIVAVSKEVTEEIKLLDV